MGKVFFLLFSASSQYFCSFLRARSAFLGGKIVKHVTQNVVLLGQGLMKIPG
jgi:hypothetical protein